METLEDVVKAQIRLSGPMDVGTYMALALGHPKLGYYMTRDPLGLAGDFTTSPEISQTFGEMVALSFVDGWMRAGQPDIHLVELGPGRGTLMSDILRCCKNAPDFFERARIHMVETSPVLRAAQAKALAAYKNVEWHDSVDQLPEDAPLVIVANEFFDALPVRQAVMTERGWRERVVGLDDAGELTFGIGNLPAAPAGVLPLSAPEGALCEYAPVREAVMASLCRKLQKAGGAMTIIDYGHEIAQGLGDTFQALHRHAPCPAFAHVGNADLTSHVNFARLAQVARDAGCTVLGPALQKDYLERLGIMARLEALQRLNPGNTTLAAGVARLVDPKGMGGLFRVLGIEAQVSFCRLRLLGLQSS